MGLGLGGHAARPRDADATLRRDRPAVSVPAAAGAVGVAQPRAAARAGRLPARRSCSAASASAVMAALFAGAFWVTWQAAQYAELGDYLIRIGLSWLFLTFLSFLAFSGVVTSLSTFFLSDDLRLMLAAPVAARRVFMARFARTLAQAGWMVVVFLVPVLAGVGIAKCAPWSFVRRGHADGRAVRGDSGGPRRGGHAAAGERVSGPARPRHPDADGPRVRDEPRDPAALHPARAAAARGVDARRDRLLRHAAVAGHAAAAVVLGGRGAVCGLQGGSDWLHVAALWTTAAAVVIGLAAAFERWHFAGFSKSQEARKARVRRVARARRRRPAAAAVAGAPAAARQGPEGVPARREPVVAAAAAARAGAGLSLQLPRARPRPDPVHERRDQERLRVPQPGHGRLRDGDGGGALRVSGGVGRRRGVLDHPHGADLAAGLPVVEVLDRAGAGAAC